MLKMDRSLSNKNITTTSAFHSGGGCLRRKQYEVCVGWWKELELVHKTNIIAAYAKAPALPLPSSPAVASWYNDPWLISMNQLQYWREICTNAHFLSLNKSEISLRFADGQRVSPVPPCRGNSPTTSAALCTARDRMSKLKNHSVA